jgi:hypothetical protein
MFEGYKKAVAANQMHRHRSTSANSLLSIARMENSDYRALHQYRAESAREEPDSRKNRKKIHL